MFITIDPYYPIQFYNECKQALKNNKVNFKEYISTKSPYYFYFEVSQLPTFINYDLANPSYTKWLVNTVKPLIPNDEYIYLRRESFTEIKGIKQYALNEPLLSGTKTNQGIFFTGTKEQVLNISKQYPRKIWFMGRYFGRQYKVFFADNLIIKNFLLPDQILVQGNKFQMITDLEVELNYKIFHEKDRLEKISETPYISNNNYYSVKVKPEISDKFIL